MAGASSGAFEMAFRTPVGRPAWFRASMIRRSVLGLYPDGHAARTNAMPLTQLSPAPDFTLVAQASRAWARSVQDGRDLPAALQAALDHIRTTRSLALLDVRVRPA